MATEEAPGELVPLGDGPSATVLAGMDEAARAAFALKVYPGRLDRGTRTQLDAELATLAALRGRTPILVADAVRELPDGRCALRMELCAQSLPELVGAFGPLTVPDTLALGRSLAAALAAAHRAGLVHGGVTPGNVLFRPSGEAVLSDFGLALRRAFPRDPARDVGFLAPETLRDGSASDRSDLYGLGAVLYLALSGRSPHQGRPGEQEGELVLRVLREPVPPLDRADLPPGLAQLLSALMAKDPDARPLDAATVAARLGTVLGPPPPNEVRPAFDDFAAISAPPPVSHAGAPPHAAAPPPRQGPAGPRLGRPLVEYGPQDAPRRRPVRSGSIVTALAVLSVLAVAAVLLLVNTPDELDVAAIPPQIGSPGLPSASGRAVQLDLDDPVDQGDHVALSWRSSEALDFAVIVAAEGERSTTILVQRNTSHQVPVDPVRKYCFLIQATDGNQVYESQAKPIRGANCVR